MKNFFKGVRKRIDSLDAAHLREQYALIAEEAASMEKIIETINRGIVVVDGDGMVTRSNPAAKELLGMNPVDALPMLEAPLGRASRREISISYPEKRSLDMQTIPFDGGTIIYLRDVTAEKAKTEEELRAGAANAVSDLAAGVAHEIGNPLNAIALNLQLLKRDPTDSETIDICMNQVKRLDGIIREFLSALRPTKPNLMPGSPADPIKNCLSTMKQQIEERSILVTLDIPAALPAVAIDNNLMEQVFFNLIKNAMEAMRDGGTIAIEISADDKDVTTSFRDSGIGMTSEQLAHLFEPYRTTKAKGTGLGLMVSARIVHDHGGTISAESTPGKGTTFSIKLPRLERRIRAIEG